MKEPTLETPDHEEVRELLPWCVNGALSKEESNRVMRHLPECPTCSLEIEELTRIQDSMIQIDAAIPKPDWPPFEELIEKCRNEPREKNELTRIPPGRRLPRAFAAIFKNWRLRILLPAIAASFLLWLLVLPPQTPNFGTSVINTDPSGLEITANHLTRTPDPSYRFLEPSNQTRGGPHGNHIILNGAEPDLKIKIHLQEITEGTPLKFEVKDEATSRIIAWAKAESSLELGMRIPSNLFNPGYYKFVIRSESGPVPTLPEEIRFQIGTE